jgi:hypothetical protein
MTLERTKSLGKNNDWGRVMYLPGSFRHETPQSPTEKTSVSKTLKRKERKKKKHLNFKLKCTCWSAVFDIKGIIPCKSVPPKQSFKCLLPAKFWNILWQHICPKYHIFGEKWIVHLHDASSTLLIKRLLTKRQIP